MKIYEYSDYKEYINAYIRELPKNGRGQFLQISKSLRVHSTLISQILKGEKHFTQEQAFAITVYFSMSELETEYFLEMYQYRYISMRIRMIICREICVYNMTVCIYIMINK